MQCWTWAHSLSTFHPSLRPSSVLVCCIHYWYIVTHNISILNNLFIMNSSWHSPVALMAVEHVEFHVVYRWSLSRFLSESTLRLIPKRMWSPQGSDPPAFPYFAETRVVAVELVYRHHSHVCKCVSFAVKLLKYKYNVYNYTCINSVCSTVVLRKASEKAET